jgi:hypothetical protein
MRLRRSCGDFTRIRGTDAILHVVKLWPHVVDGDVELWEAATIRLLRYAVIDGQIDRIDDAQQSLAFYMGSLAWRLAERSGTGVVEPSCRLGAEIEAAKLAALRSARRIPHLGYFSDHNALLLFKHLHFNIDPEPSAIAVGEPVITPSIAEALAAIPVHRIVLVGSPKQNQVVMPAVLDRLALRDWHDSAEFLIACRVGLGTAHPVVDVTGRRYVLPDASATLARLADAGWHLSWRYVDNFDRDYLLPFDGDAGLAVIHGSRRAGAGPPHPSLYPYRREASTALAPFSPRLVRNYDAGVDWSLPDFAEPDATD